MGYREAMEKAGAIVESFREFGSYEGSWLAKVNYNGIYGWVKGDFGSCSYCDAFEAEFGNAICDVHMYSGNTDTNDCEECKTLEESYEPRLSNFGKRYLENIYSQEELEETIKDCIYGIDDEEMLQYVIDNCIEDEVIYN